MHRYTVLKWYNACITFFGENNTMRKKLAIILMMAIIVAFSGCGNNTAGEEKPTSIADVMNADLVAPNDAAGEGNGIAAVNKIDLSSVDNNLVNINKAGTYELNGSMTGQIVINVPSDAKVKIILNGVSITNDGVPCIYVKNADKVILSTEDNTVNTLVCTGTLSSTDDGKKLDGAVFARDDLQLSGHGSLVVNCDQGHGVVAKDDLDIKNLSLDISAAKKAIQVNDSCTIMSGTLRLRSGSEGIEAFIIDIIDGIVDIDSGSDGINATDKHTSKADPFKPGSGAAVYIKGGSVTIDSGADGIDSNGDLFISGGELTIISFNSESDFALDCTGKCEITGGVQNIPEN